MTTFNTILLFIISNVDTIIGTLLALHGLALTIVNLTPTPADDIVVGKIYKVVEVFAGIFGTTAKELPNSREMRQKIATTVSASPTVAQRTNMAEVDAWLNRKS